MALNSEFKDTALAALPDGTFSFLLFPVERPEFFDAVVLNGDGRVKEIQVKQRNADSNWVWGAFKMPGGVFEEMHRQLGLDYPTATMGAWRSRGGG